MYTVESFTDQDVERFKKLADRHIKRATKSKAAAIKSLQGMGILGADGKLAPQYRSVSSAGVKKPQKSKHARTSRLKE